MSITLIAVLVGVIVALLIVKAKQNKQTSSATKKQTTSSVKSTPKKAITASKPEKKQSELNNLMIKIDRLIADKEYAKAEGFINLSLNQNHELHELYFKLLKVYQLQNDDFAIKQLLDTVKNLDLNSVYQQLYSEQESFIANRTDSSSPKHTFKNKKQAEKETLPQEENNTLAFDNIERKPEQLNQESGMQSPSLDFNLSEDKISKKEIEPIKPANENNTLDFNLDNLVVKQPYSTNNEPASQLLKSDQDDSTNTLEFSLENPTESPTTSSLETKELSFSFTPEPPTSEEHTVTQPIDIQDNLDTKEVEITHLDQNDPILQAFSELSTQDPIDLDIALAEQYIYLGNNSAAKQLLSEQSAPLSNEQSEKVQQLLEKIA